MSQPFEYYRPKTRLEALELLSRPDLHAAPLIIHPKPTAPRETGIDVFVDLSLLGLDYIRTDDGGSIHIGALATLQEMVESPFLKGGAPLLLSQAAGLAAGPGIRNLSGLWGAVRARSGPPEIVLALLVVEAQIVLLEVGEKQRTVPFQEFREMDGDSIPRGEMVLEACLPPFGTGCGWALDRVARTPRDEAIVAAAAIVKLNNGVAAQVRLALAGAHPFSKRLPELENSLVGKTFDANNLRAAIESVMEKAEPIGDIRGSPEYRRSMAGLLTRRALMKAWERAAAQGTEV